MKRLLPILFSVVLLSACASNMDYDISDGINREVTLFQDAITVPLHSRTDLRSLMRLVASVKRGDASPEPRGDIFAVIV